VKFAYGLEWTPGLVVLGALLVLPFVPGLVLIGLVVAALAGLVALAGAIVAAPYLLVRTLRRRLAERHQTAEDPGPMATATPA
jgi:Flp pilus assembly protein TadB